MNLMTYRFKSLHFWFINASMFISGGLLVAYSMTLGEQPHLMAGGLIIMFSLIRTFVKPRPPKYLEIDIDRMSLRIDHYLPRATQSEVIDLSNVTSAEVEIKYGRYPETVLQLNYKDGSTHEIVFDAEIEGRLLPKVTVSKQLREICESINRIIPMQTIR